MRTCGAVLLFSLIVSAPGAAIIGPSFLPAIVPAGFTDAVYTTGSAIQNGVAMQFAPDGRLFVCQQAGALKVYDAAGAFLATAITLPVDSSGERGLLGVAFDPAFGTNGHIYLYHTPNSLTPRQNRISRFTMSGNLVAAGSEMILVTLDDLSSATNHNGGAMNFGPDGKLYVAVGENANTAHAQSIANRLGKILRYNSDGSIPSDNPTSVAGIAGTTTGANRAIWAAGLRNPFTFHMNGSQMFINDVGGGSDEEVNVVTAGARTTGLNFGWPTTEGDFNQASFPNFTRPRYAYPHGDDNDPLAGNCIAGGAFYPAGGAFPAAYHGKYFFADFTAHWIGVLDPAGGAVGPAFATGLSSPVDLKVRNGVLYYLDRGSGAVRQIQHPVTGTAPSITDHPDPITRGVGQTATFSVAASGSATLTYQWQKDMVNLANGGRISGATSPTLTITNVQASDAGNYRCVVTNSFGTATSNAAMLTVTSNQAPSVTITSPAGGSFYNGGQTITYSATGTDPEDGALGAAAFSWTIAFHHDTHAHPFLGPINGQSNGTFQTAVTGHTETNVWYRITVTVTDTGGLQSTAFVDIHPNVVTLTLQTNPGGLQVTYNGQPFAAPYVVPATVGMQVPIGAVSPQTSGGNQYDWTSWSDGGAVTHTITVPANSTTYTAVFTQQPPQAVSGLVLYDADTDLPVAGFNPIANGATLDRALLPANLTIVATTTPNPVGSVRMVYDTTVHIQTESTAPYSISGDAAGNLNAWLIAGVPAPAVGAHTIVATPYTGAAAAGAAGTPLTISFTVINGTTPPPPAPTPTPPPAPTPAPPPAPAPTPPPGGGGGPGGGGNTPQGDARRGVDEQCWGAVGSGLPFGSALLGALAALAAALAGRRRAKS